MRFQVPQYIEVEDKLFGSLTFKQFVYLAGGVGVCIIFFTFLPKFLAFILSAPFAALAGALAFYKYNDKPFINFLESFFKYSTTNKLYVWKKEETPSSPTLAPKEGPLEQVYVPKLSESKLKDLSWSLDIKENKSIVTDDNTGPQI